MSTEKTAVEDARKALNALRLEVPQCIADDVSAKVEAAFTELSSTRLIPMRADEVIEAPDRNEAP